jgi:hypothetical protein
MGGERSLLLRRSTPLLAVMVFLAPSPARASSFTPDPPPGAATLKPDAAPAAATPVVVKPRVPSASRPSAPVVRRVVVRAAAPVERTVVRAPVVTRSAPPRTQARPKPKPTPKPGPAARPKPRLVVPTLPPVLVPRFVEAPLAGDPPRALAALALALAALTALSGAGVVFSWSRR